MSKDLRKTVADLLVDDEDNSVLVLECIRAWATLPESPNADKLLVHSLLHLRDGVANEVRRTPTCNVYKDDRKETA